MELNIKTIVIEFENEVIDSRVFRHNVEMNKFISMWKKRYGKLYYASEVYITIQSKMNKNNFYCKD